MDQHGDVKIARLQGTLSQRVHLQYQGAGSLVPSAAGSLWLLFAHASLVHAPSCSSAACLTLHTPGLLPTCPAASHAPGCRYESLGQEGYHSLFKWYQRFEAEAFPDPQDLRGACSRWTGGLYPGVLQAAFALFDVPEAIAVSRSALCQGVTSLTRLQVATSHGMSAAWAWAVRGWGLTAAALVWELLDSQAAYEAGMQEESNWVKLPGATKALLVMAGLQTTACHLGWRGAGCWPMLLLRGLLHARS